MVDLFGTQFYLKPGKVLLSRQYLEKEDRNNLWKKHVNPFWTVKDVAKNVANFKKDFPVEIGDSVILEYSYHHKVMTDPKCETEYAIINAAQIQGCFKGGLADG